LTLIIQGEKWHVEYFTTAVQAIGAGAEYTEDFPLERPGKVIMIGGAIVFTNIHFDCFLSRVLCVNAAAAQVVPLFGTEVSSIRAHWRNNGGAQNIQGCAWIIIRD